MAAVNQKLEKISVLVNRDIRDNVDLGKWQTMNRITQVARVRITVHLTLPTHSLVPPPPLLALLLACLIANCLHSNAYDNNITMPGIAKKTALNVMPWTRPIDTVSLVQK